MLDANAITILLPAAGQGSRMGQPINKLFLELRGKPVILHTLRALEAFRQSLETSPIGHYSTLHVILIARDDEFAQFRILAETAGLTQLSCTYVTGGPTRQASVHNGLKALRSLGISETTPVLIHDAARCFVSERLLRSTAELAALGIASAPGLASTDTLRQIERQADGTASFGATIDREHTVRMQTPQAAPYGILVACHEAAAQTGIRATDDVALLLEQGHEVRLVPGDPDNIKLTTPHDLHLAEYLLGGPSHD